MCSAVTGSASMLLKSARGSRAIQQRLRQQGFNVTPLIDVSVLEAPTTEH